MKAWEAKEIADKVNCDKEFKYWLNYLDFVFDTIEDTAKKGNYRVIFDCHYKINDTFKRILEHLGYKVRVLKGEYQFEVSWKE